MEGTNALDFENDIKVGEENGAILVEGAGGGYFTDMAWINDLITYIRSRITLKGFMDEMWKEEHDSIASEFLQKPTSTRLVAVFFCLLPFVSLKLISFAVHNSSGKWAGDFPLPPSEWLAPSRFSARAYVLYSRRREYCHTRHDWGSCSVWGRWRALNGDFVAAHEWDLCPAYFR
jgi:hypothetical protein